MMHQQTVDLQKSSIRMLYSWHRIIKDQSNLLPLLIVIVIHHHYLLLLSFHDDLNLIHNFLSLTMVHFATRNSHLVHSYLFIKDF